MTLNKDKEKPGSLQKLTYISCRPLLDNYSVLVNKNRAINCDVIRTSI